MNALLEKGIKALDLNIDAEKLETLLALLAKWNKAYNLTAITSTNEMVVKHILDSLSIASLVNGERILDVGTGPGFPGIPLAICFPEKQFNLCDSNRKKVAFVTEAKRVLQLDNITVIKSRIETYHSEVPFDTITSRAFSSSFKMYTMTKHLISDSGQWLLMKGVISSEELLEVKGIKHEVIPLNVPFNESERHCLRLFGEIHD